MHRADRIGNDESFIAVVILRIKRTLNSMEANVTIEVLLHIDSHFKESLNIPINHVKVQLSTCVTVDHKAHQPFSHVVLSSTNNHMKGGQLGCAFA